MKLKYVKPHKTLPKSGCVICGGKPEYQGVFVPDGSTRIYGYPICGTCRELTSKDPSLLGPIEEALIAGAEDA